MLALDPPLVGDATVGGVVASNDSGPLRHRYGGVRDLVVGINVALSDGTLAKAGGKVIKNVAGYDLGKLFAGSLGTLGLITQLAVRLHPYPTTTATVTGSTDDPDKLGAAARALAAPAARGRLPRRALGGRRRRAVRALRRHRRAAPGRGQRSARARGRPRRRARPSPTTTSCGCASACAQRGTAVLKVSGRPSDLAAACRAAEETGGRLVGRAALGLFWIALEGDGLPERITSVRAALAPRACVLLDAPEAVRAAVDPWGATPDPGALAVMARVKERFDPARIFSPGAFVGGL